MTKRAYWYCFSYSFFNNGQGGVCCTYSAFPFKDVLPLETINSQKGLAAPNVPADSLVLIAITYLGYMSKAEFTGKDD